MFILELVNFFLCRTTPQSHKMSSTKPAYKVADISLAEWGRREIELAENAIRKAVEGGMTLLEARTKFKYHSLQTRQK